MDQLISQKLLQAQVMAAELFMEIERQKIIRAGRFEREINLEIYQLAFDLYGIKKYWHKRIVRAGANTLFPYEENPPDLRLKENDIVFLDFGPVFEDWEADFGRTYVLGDDRFMHRIRKDITDAFRQGKAYFQSRQDITAAQLYHYMAATARDYGWTLGGRHCGHLVGQFPHERIEDHEIRSYIHPENHRKLRSKDAFGKECHWILEVHFVDHSRQIGGFTEELLTL